MSSHQKVIPLTDNQMNNENPASEQPDPLKAEEADEEPYANEEDELLDDDNVDIFKLAEVSWEVRLERFRAKLTYDYFKSSMRWLLETASMDLSFTVSEIGRAHV